MSPGKVWQIVQRGWTIWTRFDVDTKNGREHLDVYSMHRMTNDRHVGMYANGEQENLPAIAESYVSSCIITAYEHTRFNFLGLTGLDTRPDGGGARQVRCRLQLRATAPWLPPERCGLGRRSRTRCSGPRRPPNRRNEGPHVLLPTKSTVPGRRCTVTTSTEQTGTPQFASKRYRTDNCQLRVRQSRQRTNSFTQRPMNRAVVTPISGMFLRT